MTERKASSYSVLHHSIVNLGGVVVFNALNLAVGIILSRELGEAGIGRFQLTIAIGVFLATAAKFGLDVGVTYFAPKYRVEDASKATSLIRRSLATSLVFGVGLGALVAISAPLLDEYVFTAGQLEDELRLLGLFIPVMALYTVSLGSLRACERTDLRTYVNYFAVPVIFLAVVAATVDSSEHVERVLGIRIATYVFGAVVAIALLTRLTPRSPKPLVADEKRSLYRYSFPLMFVGLFLYLVEHLDLLMLGMMLPDYEVGLFSVAARAAILVMFASSAIDMVAGPILARLYHGGESGAFREAYETFSRWVLRLVAGIAIFLFVTRREVLAVFGPGFVEASDVISLLLLAYTAKFALGLNSTLLTMAGRAKLELGNNLFVLVTLASLNLVLIPRYGIEGAGIATAITLGLGSIVRAFEASRIHDWWRIIPGTLRVAVAAALTGVSYYFIYDAARSFADGPALLGAGAASFTILYLVIFAVVDSLRADIRYLLRQVSVGKRAS